MIQANELRRNNFVCDKESGAILRCTEIKSELLAFIDRNNNPVTRWSYQVSGITLTTEILKKCGFVIIENYTNDKLFSLGEINYYTRSGKFTLGNPFEWHELDISVKYLHQLQNLHYALTGEELQYKQL